jgi:2-dehydro-3-deoxyphosphogalactonate aldolase
MKTIQRRDFIKTMSLSALALSSTNAMGLIPNLISGGTIPLEGQNIKITGMNILVIDNIPPYSGQRKWLLIQIETNQGIIGLGERPTGGIINLKPQITLLQDFFNRFIIGENPFDIEKLWQKLYASVHDYRHPGLYATPAISAIEMACWDIIGKVTGQPVYNLLGGRVHNKLRAYGYFEPVGAMDRPEVAGEQAIKLVEQGITCCKMDPLYKLGGPYDFSLDAMRRVARIFESIRKSVGDKLEIGFGGHGQFTTAGAIRLASILEPYNPYFFEEPVHPENVDEMARVAAHTNIPIASGERLVTKFEFTELLQKQAAQIIQLDVGQCGGILESKKIAGIAEAHYATIAPHMYCGPVAFAAAVQLDTCSPNFLIQEYNYTDLHSDILINPIKYENGFITPPIGPGLGIELNENVVKKQLSFKIKI